MSGFTLKYQPDGAVAKRFMRDDSFFRGLMGPVGSGKSVACCIEIFRRACAQAPGPDGIRRTRWVVIRNTTPQLKTTTIKTWLDWFPEEAFGKFNWQPPFTHAMKFGDVDAEIIFLALDRPEDVRKLLSLEVTGAFVNETREIVKPIIDVLTTRVGRYPSRRDGDGATWAGIIADTNAPGPDHWWPIMAGDCPPPDWMSKEDVAAMVRPADWRFFKQPPAMLERRDAEGAVTGYVMNPEAENLRYLDPKYYPRLVAGKARNFINVYALNRYDEVFDGQPVYPTFRSETHVAKERLMPFPGHTIWVGLDFGLTPAATFGQHVRGRDFLLRELVGVNIGTLRFIPQLKAFMAEHFPGYDFRVFGDPAGDTRAQTDETTPFQILRANGIHALPTGTNDPMIRQGAIEQALALMVDGLPGYVVSPCCTTIIRGFEGGYHVKAGGRDADKNSYSHPHDAEQYRMLGRGAGRGVVRSGQRPEAFVSATGFSPRAHSGVARGGGFRPRGL